MNTRPLRRLRRLLFLVPLLVYNVAMADLSSKHHPFVEVDSLDPSTGSGEDCTPPGANASAPGILTCGTTSLTLSGSSPTSGVTFSWTGPETFESGLQNPVISVPGLYTLVVTNPADGCTSSATVSVSQDITLPSAAANVSNVLNCLNASVTLQATTNISNGSFLWIGPGTYLSTAQNPTTTVPGGYTLNVTNPVNGCTSTAVTFVNQNITLPAMTASISQFLPTVLTCTTPSVRLKTTSSTAGLSLSWSGPGGFSSTLDSMLVSTPGVYTVVGTNPVNGCSSSASVTVTQNITVPSAAATASGQITCSVGSITLTGSSTATDVTYGWTGPSGFTSIVQSPLATTAGSYILTVTKASNGCTGTATVGVVEDIVSPGATATVSGQLNCTVSSVTLQGTATASNATFRWLGPSDFVATTQNATASLSGGYTLITTNPLNGCTSTTVVGVTQSRSQPTGVSASVSGSLTCTTSSVTVSGTSLTSGVTYSWSGPGSFTSTAQNPVVTAAGTYTVTVTNPVNTCSATASVVVNQSVTLPGATASASGNLTCTALTSTLSGSSPTAGVTYSWVGPGTFTSSIQNPIINAPGAYTLTVTNPGNSCVSTATATVTQNITLPGATASAPSPLTCTATSVTINGTSSTSGVTYGWTGPGTFTSALQNPVVSTPGTYTLTVTNPSNNCTSTSTASVTQNVTLPGATASSGGTLTCTTTSIALAGSSATSGVSYSWTGPSSFVSSVQNPSVTAPGAYVLTVTNPVNNCTSIANVTVSQNVTPPAGVTASVGGTLTCTTTSITLTGSSTTSGVTYSWTGPGSFVSSVQSPVVSAPGNYTLIVRNTANGCTSSVVATVSQNITVPSATASTQGTLTCSVQSVTITATTNASGATYAWTGPGSFTASTASASPTVAGTYSVLITNPANGCTATTSTTVNQNKTIPGVSSGVLGGITCSLTSVNLTSSSPTSGVLFNWTGPSGYSSTQQNPMTTVAGVYTVIATNPANGCSSTSTVSVSQDITPPANVAASSSDILTCLSSTTILQGSTSSAGSIEFSWTGPFGYATTEQEPEVDVAGVYTVTATNTLNGCHSSANTTVLENLIVPTVGASAAGLITCLSPSVVITGTSESTVTYAWIGPGSFTSTSATPLVTAVGTYTLTVTDPANGCNATTSVLVDQNTTVPASVTASASGTLTCLTTGITLSGNSSTAGVSYSWSGSGFASVEQNPVTSVPGLYTVTATHPVSGCSASAAVTVGQNITVPAALTAGTSGTSTLTCTTGSVNLTASSSTPGVSYSWTGPASYTSATQNPTVSASGTYTVTASLASNGCSSTASVDVSQNTALPADVTATASGVITCTVTSITITGHSSTPGVTYAWSGPSFTSTVAAPSVTASGTYSLVVTDPSNGCQATTSVLVSQDKASPTGAAINNTSGGVNLTCFISPLIFTGTSTTSGVTYSWSSASGYTATGPVATITAPGVLTLTVTGTNGCTTVRQRTVTQSLVNPTVTSSASGTITCTTPSIGLTSTSSGTPVTFSWTGPSGFTSNVQNPAVTVGGNYQLTVTTPAGCVVNAPVLVVAQNTTAPAAVTATASGNLNCSNVFVTLSGSSTTGSVTYGWSGPGGFSSTQQNVPTSIAGSYTLTVTSPSNGCSTTALVSVINDGCANSGRLSTASAASAALVAEVDATLGVEIYPQPIVSQGGIRLSSSTALVATVELYTLLNVKLATLYNGEVKPGGDNNIVFDTDSYASGVYIYRITYLNKQLQGRLMITH